MMHVGWMRPTTGTSLGWRCRHSARSWPSRSTCSPTRPSWATSAPTSWPGWRWHRPSCSRCTRSSSSWPTARRPRSHGCVGPATSGPPPTRRCSRCGCRSVSRWPSASSGWPSPNRCSGRWAPTARSCRTASSTCGSACSGCPRCSPPWPAPAGCAVFRTSACR